MENAETCMFKLFLPKGKLHFYLIYSFVSSLPSLIKIATFCMRYSELFLRFGNCETYIFQQFLVDSLVGRRSAYININIHTFYTFLYEFRLHVPVDVCLGPKNSWRVVD